MFITISAKFTYLADCDKPNAVVKTQFANCI